MTLDVRCAAELDPSDQMRCQLYVGHVGEHALLAIRSNERVLVQWSADAVADRPFGPNVSVQLPWAPGLPSPVTEPARPRPARSAGARSAATRPVGVRPARSRPAVARPAPHVGPVIASLSTPTLPAPLTPRDRSCTSASDGSGAVEGVSRRVPRGQGNDSDTLTDRPNY
jgi:hypothetical protein